MAKPKKIVNQAGWGDSTNTFKNMPFADFFNKINENEKTAVTPTSGPKDFDEIIQTKADLIADLDYYKQKKPSLAKDIFLLLNEATYKKNQANNKYLHDFESWFLELLEHENQKVQARQDLKHFTDRSPKRVDREACAFLFKLTWSIKDQPIQSKAHVTRVENKLISVRALIEKYWTGACSNTRMVYQILKKLNKIPENKKNQIKRFVEFVDIATDLWYHASNLVRPYIHKTIFGLYKSLPIWFVFDYFKDPNKTWFEYLDGEYLNKNKAIVFDSDAKKPRERTLYEVSGVKKIRIEKSTKDILEAEKNWSFLMYGNQRFIVDVGWRITDWAEWASMNGYWIIKIFPDWGLYIYSPSKLLPQVWWYDVINNHVIIDEVWSWKDLNKLLDKFNYVDTTLFFWDARKIAASSSEASDLISWVNELVANKKKLSWELEVVKIPPFDLVMENWTKFEWFRPRDFYVDPWSRFNLKEEIINYRKQIEDKNLEIKNKWLADKEQKKAIANLWSQDMFDSLPDKSFDELEIEPGKDYDWIVNSVERNRLFASINRGNTARWILHIKQIEDIELFKSIGKWDKISVKIHTVDKSTTPPKISFKLNKIIEKAKNMPPIKEPEVKVA